MRKIISEKEMTNASLQNSVVNLTRDLQESETMLREYENQVELHVQKYSIINSSVSDMQSQNDRIVATINIANATNEELKKKVDEQSRELSTNACQINDANKQDSALVLKYSQLKEKYNSQHTCKT